MKKLQQTLAELSNDNFRFGRRDERRLLRELAAAEDHFMDLAKNYQQGKYTNPVLIQSQVKLAMAKKRMAIFYQQHHPEQTKATEQWQAYLNALHKIEHMLIQLIFQQSDSSQSAVNKSKNIKKYIEQIDIALDTGTTIKSKQSGTLNNLLLIRKQIQTIPSALSVAKTKYYEKQIKLNQQQQAHLTQKITLLEKRKITLVNLRKLRIKIEDAKTSIAARTKKPTPLERWFINPNRGAIRTFILRALRYFNYGPDEVTMDHNKAMLYSAQRMLSEAKGEYKQASKAYKRERDEDASTNIYVSSIKLADKYIADTSKTLGELENQQLVLERQLEASKQTPIPSQLIRDLSIYIRKFDRHIQTGHPRELENFYVAINFLHYKKHHDDFSANSMTLMESAVSAQSEVDLDDCREHLAALVENFKRLEPSDKLKLFKKASKEGEDYLKKHPGQKANSDVTNTLKHFLPRLERLSQEAEKQFKANSSKTSRP